MTELLASRGPAELLSFLAEKRAELDILDANLQAAHEVAESAEEAWIEHLDLIIEDLMDGAQASKSRLPGEDVRVSIARRRGGAQAWVNHRRADRNVKKLEGRERLISKQIGAAQSEAKLIGVV